MKKYLAAAALLAFATTTLATPGDWHRGLYLGNDGYWRQRVRIEIRNEMDREAAGEPVGVRIGTRAGEAALAGASAGAVRVCDETGVEMLWLITSPAGEPVVKGPIAGGSLLTIPAECPAHATANYYVYFDNPAAWRVPDFLEASIGIRNGGLENGAGEAPAGWRHDTGDDEHRARWVPESPHRGKRCLKTIVAEDVQPTWIATRQRGIHIVGGAKYIMRAWVKAEDVKGFAGWYIHVGNKENTMMIAPMLSAGGGTYDWQQVTAEFVAPEEANLADLGTVLRGTGIAWFDDVTLECQEPSKLTATAAKPERLEMQEIGADAKWYDDNPADDVCWDYRAAVRVMNFSDQPVVSSMVSVDMATLMSRLRGKINEAALRVTYQSKVLPHCQCKDNLLFAATLPAHTMQVYYVYFSADERIDQVEGTEYAGLLAGSHNLVKNASFETEADLPDDWPGAAEGQRPVGATMRLDEPGLFGKRCVRLHIPHDAKKAWTGWRQHVPVEPGKTYFFAAWVKCEDVQNGSVQLHAHYRNPAGELCEQMKHTGTGPAITGTEDWTVMSGMFIMPEDVKTFELHLTMLATGTVWHDGVVLVEAARGAAGRLEARTAESIAGLAAWPVNALVKVFQDDAPPRRIVPARISAARNDKEPLQLAIRSANAIEKVSVELDAPANARGAKLTAVEVGVVGYVPVDHKTNYYNSHSPAWQCKYPTAAGRCDGWPGMWPDPILPRRTFALAANTTQPVWITVSVPKIVAAGDYTGKVRLVSEGETLKEIPFTVRVWDFTLPDENHLAAIYDLRLNAHWWRQPGKTRAELHRQFWRFMAERRVSPHRIYPDPKITYENGKVSADFTEFDKAAERYFNVLKMPHTYTPWYFYCFGWGNLPGKKFGEQPYEGEYPYEGVDRSRLRPAYKKAYQACLKVYWDHLKEKGWDKKCVLYISDEPFDRHEHIIKQMKALCDMIHEAAPDIPIYCSTWKHVPQWDGYLDVWGVGHYGRVMPDKLKELQGAGSRIWWTTDGQMCTDTPYCAIERLLPHYCFKYGVEAYEFWGIDWLTYNPYEFGWHRYNIHTFEPGAKKPWVRYPNGDGFLAYPGGPIGHDGPVTSVRLEQAREGVEDYEYLYLLRQLIATAKAAGNDATQAQDALGLAAELIDMPSTGGRYSTKILPDPDAVFEVRRAVAQAIEKLRQ